MQDGYDAIIVGAGINSLACAVHLGAKGWRVGVFEQAETPGGAVKTLELTEPGFRHDWAAMNLSLLAGSGFFKAYGEDLTRRGLEFAPASHCFASVFENGRWLGVSTGPGETRARIAGFSENDAKAWDRLCADFPGTAEFVFALLGNPMQMHIQGRLLAKALWRKGFAWTADLARLLLSSPRTWLTETFESDHVRATLAAWGMHLDFAPDMAGGAVFPYLESMASQHFGMVIGKGGADTAVTALLSKIKASGGEVHCGQRVARVIHTGGKATGIELADGTKITARRAVIANVAPGGLMKLLDGTSGDAAFDAKMTKFSHAPGTMMIHLALDGLPDWSAGEELKSFAYVHIAPSLDQMARTYQQAVAGLLPDEPVLVVGQPTAIDPSRAPEGKHVLWVQVRMVPGEILGDAAGQITGTDWATVKETYADRAIDMIERHAPGLKSKIIGRAVVSPLDLETDNPNLVGGDQVAGSHHLSQNFLFRPALGHATGKTPVEGLHITGASVWPGAGTGAGAGYMLARKLGGK
ncbi:MAG: NAD(P)/FAD-dependent oxidoreductase [Hoeflea sp.]|uniref:phytoene desaturase family protein n=1 Tax=Hoeflea sp. TaxID=1940281 RepID=UPI001D48FD39|nr:NAD(P)/FAD-dependent oxidoreductase [Hoeflea sp.]MBU4528736.1 NAD(P)/FAD-dependent oxidoreductase [Alphaproteobacteria bacterium]MBU4545937.1 NAD(P)/FAD-dependent oxidoreductase [Alphaproteobacteria bacterium]MBU4549870.1 NAD(P)/FAD-dependent oxidoreductase [Alphaproteobacteria bacterium]MBV1725867.1 NAD(P)/FAD-dependent oxidoreductase [Hoeflea sp.]MBV1762592.1 NAD(P)/FAD-dependent oxidoreductase [Hoeflea sp.]